MVVCKHCNSTQVVKNGFVRKKQRYLCKNCSRTFVIGDARRKESLKVKKALAVILYSLGKASFGFLAKLFGVSRSLTYRWIKEEAESLPEPVISNEIKEIEFDEMWHFIQSKKTKYGLSRRWIVAEGELLPGLLAIVMLQPSDGYTKNLNN
ncbi:hypothetical protein JCM12298_30580 [Desulfothermus naphthae]